MFISLRVSGQVQLSGNPATLVEKSSAAADADKDEDFIDAKLI
jgi:hypothetical protein